MNLNLISAMQENIQTLNNFDFSHFDEKDVQWISESLEEIKALCRIYVNVDLGLMNKD